MNILETSIMLSLNKYVKMFFKAFKTNFIKLLKVGKN